MERPSIEGERPVLKIKLIPMSIQSSTGHVKPGVNMCRPLHKAKYKVSTDSEQVPRGKGEKNPC